MADATGAIQCELCPKGCVLAPGESGDCRIRVHLDGRLRAVTWGHPSAVHVDPIEKKPLFHFLPGSRILSIATVGCNLHCRNCQNWELSQRDPEDAEAVRLEPADVVRLARRHGCPSIAYTYSEPLVFYEYTLDCSVAAREAGLRNVLVTAGYIREEPLRELCRSIDAANVDLKAMSDRFYREVCDATLSPVLRALEICREENVLVEVTNLLIPTLNDSDRDIGALCAWIRDHLGRETPLHFSRFHPWHRLRNLPPTPREALLRAREIALASGLHHVYVGNLLVEDGGTTRCPGCGSVLLRRTGYHIDERRLKDGRCPDCDSEVHGTWN